MEWMSAVLRIRAAFFMAFVAVDSGCHPPVRASAPTDGSMAAVGLPARVSLSAVACPTAFRCFAAGVLVLPHGLGGMIARTVDGGKHWTVQHRDSNRQLSGISCPSTTRCYVIGIYPGPHRRGIGTIFRTQNAGVTWQQSPAPFQSLPVGVACPGLTTCFIPATGADGRTIILTTSDGGTTWSTRQTALRLYGPFGTIACPNPQVCYVYGRNRTGTGVLRTRDAGSTWRLLPGTNMPARMGNHNYFDRASVACPSARVCYTVDGDAQDTCDRCVPFGVIFGTQDGGTHWHRLYTGTGHDSLIGPVVCPAISVCYAVGVTGLDRPGDEFVLSTRNGGQTWTKRMLPAGEVLACPNVQLCFIASRRGPAIFRTSDGGRTWQSLP
jgi:photosystem II stability/assembly factor-like uncharacterized protein